MDNLQLIKEKGRHIDRMMSWTASFLYTTIPLYAYFVDPSFKSFLFAPYALGFVGMAYLVQKLMSGEQKEGFPHLEACLTMGFTAIFASSLGRGVVFPDMPNLYMADLPLI